MLSGPDTDMIVWEKKAKARFELALCLAGKLPESSIREILEDGVLKATKKDVTLWAIVYFKNNEATPPEDLAKNYVKAAVEQYGGERAQDRLYQHWKSLTQKGTLTEFAEDIVRLATALQFPEAVQFRTFVDGIRNLNVRRNLRALDKSGLKTISEYLDQALRLEEADKADSHQEPSQPRMIAAVRCFSCGKRGHKKAECRSRKSETAEKGQELKKKKCSICEKPGHTSEHCWKNKTCAKCGIKGHVAEVCKKKAINIVQQSNRTLNQMNGWWKGRKLPFMVDGGSETNWISLKLAQQLELEFKPTNETWGGVFGDKRKPAGKVTVPVKFGSQTYDIELAVLPDTDINLALGAPVYGVLRGFWNPALPQEPQGFVRLFETGEEIPLELYDEEENRNIISSLKLTDKYKKVFEPLEFDKKMEFTDFEPYKVKLTEEAEEVERQMVKTPNWSFRDREILNKYFEERLKNGMWREITEDESKTVKFIAWPFVHRKQGKKDRPVINYANGVNKYTEPDLYTMQTTQGLREGTAKGKLFAILDMEKSFNQYRLDEDSQLHLACVTPSGKICVPQCLQMGPVNSPAAVQRRNDNMLQEVKASGKLTETCLLPRPEIDDFVLAETTDDPLNMAHDLDILLSVMEKHNIHLNLEKSRLFVSQGTIVGWLREKEGWRPLPSKVEAIRKLPYPTKIEQVRHFLGVLNEFRPFLRNYAAMAEPLTELTSKSPRVDYGDPEVLEAVDALKKALTEAPCLLPLDMSKRITVKVDASNLAWGAVMMQEDERGDLKPCMYASKLFNNAQRKYSATDRETLGVVASARHWRQYLVGNPNATFYNDHKAVSALIKRDPGELTDKQAHWLALINDWGLKIEWKPGAEMMVPDMLSRMWNSVPEKLSDEEKQEVKTLASLTKTAIRADMTIDWKMEQRKEAKLAQLINYLESAEKEKHVKFALMEKKSAEYQMKEGVLIHKFADPIHKTMGVHVEQTVVPIHLQSQIVNLVHKGYPSAHLGVDATYWKLKQQFYWDTMYSSVLRELKKCECQLVKVWKIKPGLMLPVKPQARYPFHYVGIDLAGPLPTTRRGNRFFLIMVDLFSSWIELVPLKTITAEKVMNAFTKEWVERYGIPENVISDRGKQFIGELAMSKFEELGINKKTTTSYHPQGNSVTERFVGTVKEIIRRNVCPNENYHDWDEYLGIAAYAIRTMERETRPSAGEVLFGFRLHTLPEQVQNLDITEIQERRHWICQKIQQEVEKKVAKYKAAYDEARRDITFEIGQLVLLKRPFKTGALERLYDGPFKIAEKKSDLNYRLEKLDGTNLAIHDVVNISRLKPYFGKKEEEEVDIEESEEEEEEEEEEDAEELPLDWNLMFDTDNHAEPVQAVEARPVVQAFNNLAERNELPMWIEPRKASAAEMRSIMDARGMRMPSRATRDDVRVAYENAYRDKEQQGNQGNVGHLVRGKEAVSYDVRHSTSYRDAHRGATVAYRSRYEDA